METLVLITSIVVAVLLIVIMVRIATASARKPGESINNDPSFGDLLTYAAVVDDGIIVCKNGALTASMLYFCEDAASNTADRRAAIAAHLNSSLAAKKSGWMFHIDAARREVSKYSSSVKFPDPLSQLIDNERREYFERGQALYETFFVITITWLPVLSIEKKFVELMFSDTRKIRGSQESTRHLIETFRLDLLALQSSLSAAMKLVWLKANKAIREDGTVVVYDEQLAWLNYCISGDSQPVVLPDCPIYIDNILAKEFVSGVVPAIGRKYIQTVAIDGFPANSWSGILDALSEMPCTYRWSNRFIIMDNVSAIAHLDKYRRKWQQKIRGFMSQIFQTASTNIDLDAQTVVHDITYAKQEVSSGTVSMGYYNSVVVLMHEDRDVLDDLALKVKQVFGDLGFPARIETLNTMEAYLGSLPGHGKENVRRPLFHSLNVAHFIPTSSIWTGSEFAPCPYYPDRSPPLLHTVTNGATPFRLNLHVADLGHSIIFGPTRSGKSTLIALLALQVRKYPDAKFFCFDKGRSMYPVTKGVRGKHYEISADSNRLSFAPLQYLETHGDVAAACEWIETVLQLNNVAVTPQRRNEIHTTMLSMKQGSSGRSLTSFSLLIQDNDIREALRSYTIQGPMGNLLDAEEDGLSLSDFTTFEIEDLMSLDGRYSLPVLLYLFRRIERSLDGSPTFIFIDEAWVVFNNPAFRGKVKDWLKAYGKKNCLILMSTQNISDAANTDIFDVIIDSTATKIYLPNASALNEDNEKIYKRCGLNRRQIEIISAAKPKCDYYCTSTSGRRIFQLAIGKIAMPFVGKTDLDSLQRIRELEDQYPDTWQYEWLKENDIQISSEVFS